MQTKEPNIIEISRAINSHSKNPMKLTLRDSDDDSDEDFENIKKRQPAAAKKPSPLFANFAKPPPPPPVFTPKAPAVKKVTAKAAALDPALKPDKESMIRKIDDYMHSSVFDKMITEEERETWTKADTSKYTQERLESMTAMIRSRINSKYRVQMVDTMFNGALKGGEAAMVHFLKLNEFVGVSDFTMKNRPMFEEELEEIAIEMGDGMIPSPKVRLLFKLMGMWTEYYTIRNLMGQNIDPEQQNKKQ